MTEEKNAEYYYDKGRAYFLESDNNIAALAFFDRAAELGDTSLELKYCIAKSYYNIDEYEKSLAFWNIVIADLERNPIIDDNGKPMECYSDRAITLIGLERWEEAVDDYTRALGIKPDNASFYNARAQAYYSGGNYQASLSDLNKAVELDDGDSWYRERRASVLAKTGNNAASAYDTFRAYLINAAEASSNNDASKDDEPVPRLEDNILFTENNFDILQNTDGDLLIRIKMRDGESILPELFYNGGNNALFRRRYDQFIFLESIHPDIQQALHEADTVLIAEMDSSDDNNTENADTSKTVYDEYTAKVRRYTGALPLDSIDSVKEDAYFFFAYLASLMRANPDKPIYEIIGIEDYPNLAAVLVCEEDYENLQRFHDSVAQEQTADENRFANLALNKHISAVFRDWQPTPLFLMSAAKVWTSMQDAKRMLRFLIALGADPNMPGREGDTPLSNQCTRKGVPEIMQALLEAGADPNHDYTMDDNTFRTFVMIFFPDEYDEETNTFTPMSESQAERAKLFINYGADLSYTYDSGETVLTLALIYAEGEIREELVTLLIDKGADLKAAMKGLKTGAANNLPHYQKAFDNLHNITALAPYYPACLEGCEEIEKETVKD